MTIRTRDLWPHQNDVIEVLQGEAPWKVISMPTGSGKSAVEKAAAKMMIEDGRIKTVLCASSLVMIEDGLAEPEAYNVVLGGRTGKPRRVVVPEGFWSRPRDLKGTDVGQLLDNHNVLTTQAQLIRWWRDKSGDLPDPRGRLLVIDEGHHQGEFATRLMQFCQWWIKNGGLVWSLSATLDRADGARSYPADVVPYVVTYASLAAKGLLVPNINLRIQHLATPLDADVDVDELDEEELDALRRQRVLSDQDYARITEAMLTAGRPGLLRLPGGTGDRTSAEEMSERFVWEFTHRGVKPDQILNTVGYEDEVRSECQERIAYERDAVRKGGYAKLGLRFVVSCRRASEGVDMPWISHVAFVGVPLSIPAMAQGIGRGTRAKPGIKGYPAAWQNDLLVTCFVPESYTTDEAERERTARVLLQVSAGINASNASADFEHLWEDIVTNFRLPPGTWSGLRPFVERVAGLPLHEQADAALLGAAAAAEAAKLGAPTLGDVADILEACPGPRGVRALATVIQTLEYDNPVYVEDARRALEESLRTAVNRMQGIQEPAPLKGFFEDALGKALRALAQKYAHLVVSSHTKLVRGFEALITPAILQRAAHDLERARDAATVTDVDFVAKILGPYVQKYGTSPTVVVDEHERTPSGARAPQDVGEFLNQRCSLPAIDRALRRRGLDLSLLVTAARLGYVVGPDVDLAALQRQIKRRPPLPPALWGDASGLLNASRDRRLTINVGGRVENLAGLELAARNGWRGLPAQGMNARGSALYALL